MGHDIFGTRGSCLTVFCSQIFYAAWQHCFAKRYDKDGNVQYQVLFEEQCWKRNLQCIRVKVEKAMCATRKELDAQHEDGLGTEDSSRNDSSGAGKDKRASSGIHSQPVDDRCLRRRLRLQSWCWPTATNLRLSSMLLDSSL